MKRVLLSAALFLSGCGRVEEYRCVGVGRYTLYEYHGSSRDWYTNANSQVVRLDTCTGRVSYIGRRLGEVPGTTEPAWLPLSVAEMK